MTERGFTKVPDVKYSNRNKFTFGAVLEIGNIKYYVPVSSFSKRQEANILIRVAGDVQEVKGSLRFNYMIPVPDACIDKLVIKDIKDIKYRELLNKEYMFCKLNSQRITSKAKSIYDRVINNKKQILTNNSCDFKILEKAYNEYISN